MALSELRVTLRDQLSRFALACAVATGVLVAYAVVSAAQVGGQTFTVAFEDVAEAAVALAAAASAGSAAWKSAGRVRAGWLFMASSAAAWGIGESTWSVYEVGFGRAVPFPSPADLGFVCALPLAVAGVIAFPLSPAQLWNRVRSVLDGAIAAAAFLFVAWLLVLESVVGHTSVAHLGRVLALGYPAGDFMLAALVVMYVRRASGRFRVAMLLLLAAFTANLVADASFAYLTLSGRYGVLGSQLDIGWVAGYLLIALAALWPAHERQESRGDGSVEMWQLAIPWLAILVVIVATVWMEAASLRAGPVLGWIGAGIGLLFVLSQALAVSDTLQLLARSRRAEAELAERTGLLAEVIGRAPLGIARIADDLKIIDANACLSSMLGMPARLLIGSSLARFLSDEDLAQVRQRLGLYRAGALETADVDTEMIRADGTRCWVHRTISVVRKAGGEVRYYLVMFEDVTSKHETERAALANLAALERLNRLKSEFMSMVSHEFRTALTGIQGYSEVMNTQEVTPDEVKEFSGDINADALRLNRMITEMLDLDRIESGRIALHIEPVDVNRLLCDAVDRAQVSTTKHVLVADLAPALPMVEADADRLTQVIGNLLSNAVKYSPNGGEIRVASRLVDGNVEVSVRDHGQGIPPEFVTRIFGRYERYESGANRQVVGTGLGLAIAQQIVQLHRGRIWVESRVGEGSEFRFTIPAGVPASNARGVTAA